MAKLISVSVKCSEDEFAILAWLKDKTGRSASGVYKHSAKELASALGYVKQKKPGAEAPGLKKRVG